MKIKEFKRVLKHTPALFYLSHSVLVLSRDTEEGYTEITNEEIKERTGVIPGSEGFFKTFLLPLELEGRRIDYYVIPEEKESFFRERLERFIETAKEEEK